MGGFSYTCKRAGYAIASKVLGRKLTYEEYMRQRYNPPDGHSSQYDTVYAADVDVSKLPKL